MQNYETLIIEISLYPSQWTMPGPDIGMRDMKNSAMIGSLDANIICAISAKKLLIKNPETKCLYPFQHFSDF